MTNQTLVIGVVIGSVALIAGLAVWGGGGAYTAPESIREEVELNEVDISTSTPDTGTPTTSVNGPRTANEQPLNNGTMINPENPVAVLTTTYGTIEVELFEATMPITAGNFKKLIEENFYDGSKFHRVIDGFMVQGGDPNSKTDDTASYGTGGPGYTIQDEFVDRDYLSNVRGTLAMANSGPNTGGSQFFINLVDNTNLDYDQPPLTSKHPVFGKVITGMDIVDQIGDVETGARDIPVEPIVIESAAIRE